MKIYNILVPGLDRQGPTILAMDLAYAAANNGYIVNVFYLKNKGNSFESHKNINFQKTSLYILLLIKINLHSHCLFPDLINSVLSIKEKILGRSFVSISTVPSYIYFDLRYSYGKLTASFFWLLWKLITRFLQHKVLLSETMRRYYRRVDNNYSYDVIYHSRPKDINANNSRLESQVIRRLVYVGGLHGRKNIMPLVDHVAKSKSFTLDIFGVGEFQNKIENICLNDAANIRYCGFSSDISKELGSYDCLILPSFAEGLPTVVVEAANLGLPCALSNIAVHRELEMLGVGAVFNHRNFNDFDEKIRQLTYTNEMRRQRWESNKHLFDFPLNFSKYRKLINEQ
jgi:hypothetical protein